MRLPRVSAPFLNPAVTGLFPCQCFWARQGVLDLKSGSFDMRGASHLLLYWLPALSLSHPWGGQVGPLCRGWVAEVLLGLSEAIVNMGWFGDWVACFGVWVVSGRCSVVVNGLCDVHAVCCVAEACGFVCGFPGCCREVRFTCRRRRRLPGRAPSSVISKALLQAR